MPRRPPILRRTATQLRVRQIIQARSSGSHTSGQMTLPAIRCPARRARRRNMGKGIILSGVTSHWSHLAFEAGADSRRRWVTRRMAGKPMDTTSKQGPAGIYKHIGLMLEYQWNRDKIPGDSDGAGHRKRPEHTAGRQRECLVPDYGPDYLSAYKRVGSM